MPRSPTGSYRRTVLIPEPVRAAVLRRLRRLDRSDRGVVMRASAIGCRFEVAVLLATGHAPESRVRRALERACEVQLLVSSDARSYAFRHDVTREIVYGELVAARIRRLHRLIGGALERARPDAHATLADLAYHAWAAGDADRALRFNERAGDDALALHARDDARRYFQRARSLLEIGSAAYARLTQKLASLAEDTDAAR